ncbi:SipW-dependent-type signal peptide-containing protein [Methanomethylophilus alvi]|uniref:SipW-dependent-type signal peptide-containing protein n=1 Tax=Methanomethylophilus alvi TaxID=1291540 RepID=UPI0037DCE75A
MKAETKMIVAAAVVAALALTAVSGITYSWFSDSESTEVTINTAKVDMDADFYYCDDDTDTWKHIDDANGALSLENFKPGDEWKFKAVYSNNQSTISTAHRLYAVVSGPLPEDTARYITLAETALVALEDGQTSSVALTGWTELAVGETPEEYRFSLKASSAWAVPSGSPISIRLVSELYQSNAVVTEAKIVDGKATLDIFDNAGDVVPVTMEFTGLSDDTAKVSVSAVADPAALGLSADSFVIDLNLSNGATFDSVTVTLTVPGQFDGSVLYLGDGSQPSGVTVDTSSKTGYSIITFTTNHFSQYALFDGKVYSEDVFRYACLQSGNVEIDVVSDIVITNSDGKKDVETNATNLLVRLDGGELVWKNTVNSLAMGFAGESLRSVTVEGVQTSDVFRAQGLGTGSIGCADSVEFRMNNLTVIDETCYIYENGENAWEFTYLEFCGKVSFTGVAFDDGIMSEGPYSVFFGCSFSGHNNDSSDLGNTTMYGVWVSGGDAKFTDCDFNGTRGLKVHEEYGSDVGTVTVDGCRFNGLTEKPGIAIGNLVGTMVVSDSTFTDCQPGDQGKYMYETDSMVPSCEGDNKIVFTTADSLVKFADVVNNGPNTFSGQKVVLGNDIDLVGIDWTPIGSVVSYPGKTFAGTFDGNNHTILNMKASDSTTAHATAGFFGSITGKVLNLTIDRATITSTHYAGAICGYSSSNVGMEISNCHVKNSTITSVPEYTGTGYDNGDKVGGIIGYCVSGDKVTGCTVENVTITGYRDIGGICGYSAGTVENCSVKNSTLVQDNTNGYKSEAITTVEDIIGRDGGATVSNNTSSDVVIKTIVVPGSVSYTSIDVFDVYEFKGTFTDDVVLKSTSSDLLVQVFDGSDAVFKKGLTIAGLGDISSEGVSIWNDSTLGDVRSSGSYTIQNCGVAGALQIEASAKDVIVRDCSAAHMLMTVIGANVTVSGNTFTDDGAEYERFDSSVVHETEDSTIYLVLKKAVLDFDNNKVVGGPSHALKIQSSTSNGNDFKFGTFTGNSFSDWGKDSEKADRAAVKIWDSFTYSPSSTDYKTEAAGEWIASVTDEAANNTFSASEGRWVFNLYGKNPLALSAAVGSE